MTKNNEILVGLNFGESVKNNMKKESLITSSKIASM